MTPPILDFENFYFLVDIDITSTLNGITLERNFNSQIVIRCQIEMPSGEWVPINFILTMTATKMNQNKTKNNGVCVWQQVPFFTCSCYKSTRTCLLIRILSSKVFKIHDMFQVNPLVLIFSISQLIQFDGEFIH